MATPSVMNFIKFPVSGTNIFPIANSPTGGHLLSEYNLRSRESVPVGPIESENSISYHTGPSYCHDEDSFKVSMAEGLEGSVIQIAPGRAVVNGHFVECLVPINIDLSDLDYVGKLCVGLRVMYSTVSTMSGAIKPEEDDGLFEGIQVVVAPVENFILPEDSPKDETAVTAHLKLATLRYVNGAIRSKNIVDNFPDRCHIAEASRIGGFDKALGTEYLKIAGLDPTKLYVIDPRTANPNLDDGVCDATGALLVWGRPNLQSSEVSPEATVDSAQFLVRGNQVKLVVPYKFNDAHWTNNGTYYYYKELELPLPNASYASSTPGIVTSDYTNNIKAINNRITEFYQLASGKQRLYIETLSTVSDLPAINSQWDPGDYVLVRVDNSVYISSELTRAPSTIYVVIPGLVREVTRSMSKPSGVLIDTVVDSTFNPDAWTDNLVSISDPDKTYLNYDSGYRGIPDSDYFIIQVDETTEYFYKVSQTGAKEYSQAISLTGEISLATTDIIGGFRNVDETDLDSGYVYLDEDGHLRLLDYTLLRSGLLAYQLGENFEATSGTAVSTIQGQLDDYINNRIVFPNDRQKSGSENIYSPNNPKVIHLTITLPEYDESDSSEDNILTIENIDSRFGSSVYLHILGKGDGHFTINIINCERIRIDNNIIGDANDPPYINIYNSGLFYDASVLNYIHLNTVSGLSLWHERYYKVNAMTGLPAYDEALDDGLDVNVQDLTVTLNCAPNMDADLDLWSDVVNNDNHFAYGLYQLTFNQSGNIVGFGLAVKNETTSNISDGKYLIVSDFTLPNSTAGSGLPYPENRLKDQLKVTGHFTSGYPERSSGTYYQRINETDFSAVTQWYDYSIYSVDGRPVLQPGKISFLVDSYTVTDIAGTAANSIIESIMPSSPHLFLGGAISKSSDTLS